MLSVMNDFWYRNWDGSRCWECKDSRILCLAISYRGPWLAQKKTLQGLAFQCISMKTPEEKIFLISLSLSQSYLDSATKGIITLWCSVTLCSHLKNAPFETLNELKFHFWGVRRHCVIKHDFRLSHEAKFKFLKEKKRCSAWSSLWCQEQD